MSRAATRASLAETTVQELFAEHKAYSPIELLLATNNLTYDAYQAWRKGECSTLDGALTASVDDARQLVEAADSWARSLHLQPEHVPLYGTDNNAGVELTASTDTELDAMLHTEYRAAADRRQCDIFLDTSDTQAANDLVAALRARNTSAAKAAFACLQRLDPEHAMLHHANVLIDALTAPPPSTREHALRHMATLERQWLPSASAVLRAGTRDFVTPLWRGIGAALDDGTPFDAGLPKHHASWPFANGLDWANVRRTVTDVPDCREVPVLMERLAEAEWRLRNRKAAVALWFALCWRVPQQFSRTLQETRFPDVPMRGAWHRLQDEEWDAPVTAAWLPAWMVVEEPGIARAFKPLNGASNPERAFDLLLRLHAGGSDRDEMENRRELQALHPQLFDRYLATVDH